MNRIMTVKQRIAKRCAALSYRRSPKEKRLIVRAKRRFLALVQQTETGRRILRDIRYRVVFIATGSLALNLAYALFHGVLGVAARSRWLLVLCAYYAILGVTRFAAVLCERRSGSAPPMETERFVLRISGVLLAFLSLALGCVNFVSLSESIAARYSEIPMIAIAAYTFAKLTLTAVRAAKQRGNPSPLLMAIYAVGYAEAAVSVLTLQRSMLVSFGEMEAGGIRLMNALTGAGVFLFILALGIRMIFKSRAPS